MLDLPRQQHELASISEPKSNDKTVNSPNQITQLNEKKIILDFFKGFLTQQWNPPQQRKQMGSNPEQAKQGQSGFQQTIPSLILSHHQKYSKDKNYLIIQDVNKNGVYNLSHISSNIKIKSKADTKHRDFSNIKQNMYHTRQQQMYTFFNSQKLTKGSHEYTVTIHDFESEDLFLGIGTGETSELFGRYNKFPEKVQSGIFYSCKNGWVHKNGTQIQICNNISQDNDRVTLGVDLKRQRMTFSKNGDIFFECWIPDEMMKVGMYLIVRLGVEGDNVDITYK